MADSEEIIKIHGSDDCIVINDTKHDNALEYTIHIKLYSQYDLIKCL